MKIRCIDIALYMSTTLGKMPIVESKSQRCPVHTSTVASNISYCQLNLDILRPTEV